MQKILFKNLCGISSQNKDNLKNKNVNKKLDILNHIEDNECDTIVILESGMNQMDQPNQLGSGLNK